MVCEEHLPFRRAGQENVERSGQGTLSKGVLQATSAATTTEQSRTLVLKVGHIEVEVYRRTGPASTFSGCSGPLEVITVRRVVRQYGPQAERARLRTGSATVAIRCSGKCFRDRFRMSEMGIMFT